MTRHPYGPDELDRVDGDLDAVAHELERYAVRQDADVPPGLAASIQAAIAAEPDPHVGWWQRFVAGPAAWGATGRAVAVAGVITLALAGSIAVGQVMNVLGPNFGSSPAPSPSEVSTPSATPSPSPSPSPTPTPSPSPTTAPSTPTASPTDDDGGVETPEPSDDDNSGHGGGDDNETPEPSESDHSGPGGGGGGDD